MRRLATLGLLLAAGLGGGCGEFDDWMEPDGCAECRDRGAARDDRSAAKPNPEPAAGERAGVYPDR